MSDTSPPASAGREEEYVEIPVRFALESIANTVAQMQREAVGSKEHRRLKRSVKSAMDMLDRGVADLQSELAASRSESTRLREAVEKIAAMRREESAMYHGGETYYSLGERMRKAAIAALSSQPKEGA